ncbi:MAG: PaaI family thioesterase [Gemmatimonadota bacterium]
MTTNQAPAGDPAPVGRPAAIPFPPEQRASFAEQWSSLPGMQHLGARADFSDARVCRVIIDPVQPFHRGGTGTDAVNGAVIAGLCDAAVGMVGHFQHAGKRVGTAQLSIQFLRPLRGDRVVVEAWPTRAGGTLVFARAEARDAEGVVCAVCDGIVAAIAAPAGGGPVL